MVSKKEGAMAESSSNCTRETQFKYQASSSQSFDPRQPFLNNNSHLELDLSIFTASTMLRQITPFQQACLDAYTAACALVPRNLRRTVILFGGAASIAHGILERKAKDVDILVGVEALAILDDAIINMREGFHRDCNGSIKWDKCDANNNKLFEVTLRGFSCRQRL
ncbi:hypothetical protein ONS96_004274 [Cadophora gregata f. sp. sojae]|nr:hypothetical protein ONS96_004274 [Cadophora gregata f. sp. sojae]